MQCLIAYLIILSSFGLTQWWKQHWNCVTWTPIIHCHTHIACAIFLHHFPAQVQEWMSTVEQWVNRADACEQACRRTSGPVPNSSHFQWSTHSSPRSLAHSVLGIAFSSTHPHSHVTPLRLLLPSLPCSIACFLSFPESENQMNPFYPLSSKSEV